MVLLNEIIHAAGQVRKTHSANPVPLLLLGGAP